MWTKFSRSGAVFACLLRSFVLSEPAKWVTEFKRSEDGRKQNCVSSGKAPDPSGSSIKSNEPWRFNGQLESDLSKGFVRERNRVWYKLPNWAGSTKDKMLFEFV